MNFEEIRELITHLHPKDECLERCTNSIRAGVARNVEPGPGRMTAHEALTTFTLRKRTADAAGVRICGLDEILVQLRRCVPTEIVFLFHFATSEQYFTIIVASKDDSVIGCICIKSPDVEPSPNIFA
jgi:hypothetical protein